MIKRLLVENFLAHGNTVLDLAPGLNVLTGPNNSGKSAVVEALRCLAHNPAPKHLIRHGADAARVEAELEDGTRLAWVRRPRYALYELFRPDAEEPDAPEVFAKFGRRPPEEVTARLRLGAVELETGDEIDVHLGNQREPVFLLNKPGSALAAFFAASSEAAHLIAMQGLLKDRMRRAKADKRRLEKRRAAAAGDLDRLAPLPEVELGLAAGRDLLAGLEARAGEIPELRRVLDMRAALVREIGRGERRERALSAVGPPPDLSPTRDLAGILDAALGVRRRMLLSAGRIEALGALRPPEPLPDTAALARDLAAMRECGRARRRIGKKAGALAGLVSPPEVVPLAGLARLVGESGKLRTTKERRALRLDRLRALAEPPVPLETAPLAGLVREMRSAAGALEEKRAELAGRERELAAFRDRAARKLRDVGACPLCGGDMNVDGFLDGGRPAVGLES